MSGSRPRPGRSIWNREEGGSQADYTGFPIRHAPPKTYHGRRSRRPQRATLRTADATVAWQKRPVRSCAQAGRPDPAKRAPLPAGPFSPGGSPRPCRPSSFLGVLLPVFTHEPARPHEAQDRPGGLLGRGLNGVARDLWRPGRLNGIIDPREPRNLPAPCLGVHLLGVARSQDQGGRGLVVPSADLLQPQDRQRLVLRIAQRNLRAQARIRAPPVPRADWTEVA